MLAWCGVHKRQGTALTRTPSADTVGWSGDGASTALRHSSPTLEHVGGLAQLGERLAGSQKVRGSNPLSSIFQSAEFSECRGLS